MKNKLNPRFSEFSLTYVMFLLIVIAPNLILGIFGFITLRVHESDIDENYAKSYEIILRSLTDDVDLTLGKEDDEISDYTRANANLELAEILDNLSKKSKIFKKVMFVDKLGNLVFSESVNPENVKKFNEDFRTSLISRIEDNSGKYPKRLVVESAKEDKFETFLCMQIASSDPNISEGILVLMYDQDQIFDKIITQTFQKLKLSESVNVLLSQSDFMDSDDVALKLYWEGENFPYWRIVLQYTEKYYENKTSSSTLFLLIFGSLLPLVGLALIGLRMKLVREMRVAHLKTDFISRVSHELRTPLTSIKMFSEMLDMDSIPEAQKKNCIDVIQREAERLTKLVDRVLNFSKLESRNKVFTFENTDIEKLVVETVRFFEKQIPDKDFKIKLLKDPRVKEVTVDKDGIREILLNLIENSYKYSSDDKEITVKIQRIENDLRIIVIDNGFGIPREDLNRVFQKFYRVDDQINRAIDGTGLGLSICMDIAKAHGGTIEVESERGAGSKFIVSIPLKFKPAQWTKYMVKKKYPWE